MSTLQPEHEIAWPPVASLPVMRAGDHVHLVGIAGAGMSGLARALAARGLKVSGSDRTASAELERLAQEGMTVFVGHRAEQLPADCLLVVRSPAVPDDNPELAAARQAGVPITKRAVLLGALVDQMRSVAVAGTHGKSTTSGLVTWLLAATGQDPSYFVGGELVDLGTNAHLGASDLLVIEADEYDHSFLHGHPTWAIVTSLEHDHPDLYPDLDSVVDAFRQFARLVKPEGRLILNLGSPHAAQLAAAAQAPVIGYHVVGDPQPAASLPVVWRAELRGMLPDRQVFTVWRDGASYGEWELRLPGRHNVSNALAAIIVWDLLGMPVDVGRRALAEYRGIARRFQVLGQVAGVTVIDDYAHHPTEIRATLAAARQRYPSRRLIAVLQPHTYSRVAAMAEDFANALATADRAILTPVYAARETPIAEGSSQRITERLPKATLAAGLAEAADLVASEIGPGDVALFLGAGDIPTASRRLLARLRERVYRQLLAAAADGPLTSVVRRDAPLARYTTLGIGGPADLLVEIANTEELVAWWQLVHRFGVAHRILGCGSNVLVADAGYRGVILRNQCRGWQLEPAQDGEALVVAESGVGLATLAQALARSGWAGLEAAAGIPGTVGAAVVMNAGAHGWSTADNVRWAEVVDPLGNVRRLSPAELQLGYRTSRLRGDRDHAVVRAALAVWQDEPQTITSRIADYLQRRRATQPRQASAGSVFRNPPGDFAGRLLEAAGMKGARVGDVSISDIHANFIVNHGHGTAKDVMALVRRARGAVAARFGIWLELEIEPLGTEDVA